MFGAAVEDRAITGTDSAPVRGRPRTLIAVLALIAGFLLWAATFEIEEVTRATGRVVPSGQVQRVQSLEGGIVSDIAVAEGTIVEAGDVLLRIDDTGASSRLGELTEERAALRARVARLQAQAEGDEAPTFGAETAEALQAQESALFAATQARLREEEGVLTDRLRQREAARQEAAAEIARLAAILEPLEEELRLSEDLRSRGAMPELDVLRLRARVAEERGALNVLRAGEGRREAAIDEARRAISAAREGAGVTAREDLAAARARLAIVEETILSAGDRVQRTALRAPVRGTVNAIVPPGPGAVIAAGAVVVEIVPIDDALLIEADIPPRDVAFIGPQADASVKITAYDYTVFGALPATVERIGADAVLDADGNDVFRVTLRTQAATLGDDLPIIPGMQATVDIQTGRKTVLDYLARPVLRAREEALRER